MAVPIATSCVPIALRVFPNEEVLSVLWCLSLRLACAMFEVAYATHMHGSHSWFIGLFPIILHRRVRTVRGMNVLAAIVQLDRGNHWVLSIKPQGGREVSHSLVTTPNEVSSLTQACKLAPRGGQSYKSPV